jgi:hypothetical protein
MGALAFIVISFVASTWEFVPATKQSFAFIGVEASGAHFIFSLAFALPCILLSRFLRRSWSISIGGMLGAAGYIYCALILQHWGLASSLLSQSWISIFPLGNTMISLVQGPQLQAIFYAIPLVVAWTIALPSFVILGLGLKIIGSTKRARPSEDLIRR